jgi:hypothetical protein
MTRNIFKKSCRLLDRVAKYCRLGQATMITRRKRIACWIPKAINTHPGCVLPIAFPMQQMLQKSVPMLRYTHIASKDKAGPEGSSRLRLPDLKTIGT